MWIMLKFERVLHKSSHYLRIKDKESMKTFNDLLLKFKNSDWFGNPEFYVIDSILEARPDLILLFRADIIW